MVLIRRQMKARKDSEGHRLSTWLSECFSGERHKDPHGIKQTFECLVLKTVNSICVDWTYAARLGSQCFLLLWISTTCNPQSPAGTDIPEIPASLSWSVLLPCPWSRTPFQPSWPPSTNWYSGLASDATVASGHLQAALVPAGDGLWLVRFCLATLLPVSSIAASPRKQPALAQHNNLHKIWSCRTSA